MLHVRNGNVIDFGHQISAFLYLNNAFDMRG